MIPELKKHAAAIFVMLLLCTRSLAHPMPNSILLMDIKSKGVSLEIQLPLSELQLAVGYDVTSHTEQLVERHGMNLKKYILAHIRPVSASGRPWQVELTGMEIGKSEQTATGPYQELAVKIWMQAPQGTNNREFILNYDVIIHQVVTHSALISVRQDWEAGIDAEHPVEVGAIALDTRNNIIPPLRISLDEGSKWKGFKSMVRLGIDHIAAGTDHLMFLLVLLLPAPLLVHFKSWGAYGGARYSILRLLKIITAFTLGHSITLLLGTFGWLQVPAQVVEILIAFSILISAIHAIKPVFPGKEIYIAAGFGLVHGLAFAGTLANLNLEIVPTVISILGFNIGIELMQLFVIAVTVPWLIILAKTSIYKFLRIGGSVFASIAAIAWMVQRYLGKENELTVIVEGIAAHAHWIILALAVLALTSLANAKRKRLARF